MSNWKSINGLMMHLRNKHNIEIGGSSHKRQLRNIGYYHGFKGYRYINNPANRVNYSSFDELLAVNNFDMELKALFYPKIMYIETALKNYVLEILLEESKSSSFNEIYENLITGYKRYTVGSDNYKKAMKRRLDLRNKIYNTLTVDYIKGKKVVEHFYHKDVNVPIWGIFECLNFGEFGYLISCLNDNCRRKSEALLNFNLAMDSGYTMLQDMVFSLKDLRNSIAHNDVIFDIRFQTNRKSKAMKNYLSNEVNIKNIEFKSITDYVILVVYLMSCLKLNKREINRFILDYEEIINRFRKVIPNICNKVLLTDTRSNIAKLKEFVKTL